MHVAVPYIMYMHVAVPYIMYMHVAVPGQHVRIAHSITLSCDPIMYRTRINHQHSISNTKENVIILLAKQLNKYVHSCVLQYSNTLLQRSRK